MTTNINEEVEIAIIGGTGVYDSGLMNDSKRVKIHTPYGATSDFITIGTYAGRKIAFLARHGEHHSHPPHLVPYRANIWALKQLGVKRIIAPCAVGSLRQEIVPGDIVIADQFFDFTKQRDYTFYESSQVCHISVAEPFCKELRSLAIDVLAEMKVPFHPTGTNVAIQGPRYSTKAESEFFRNSVNAHIVGMTLVPECTLARELEMCYLCLAAATDYDSWSKEPVDTASVKKTMAKNLSTVRTALQLILPLIPTTREKCSCGTALENAMI